MLEFKGVTKSYRVMTGTYRLKYKEVLALSDANLIIPEGETMAILGPNGAGKSTICKIAAGMVKPTRGHALLDGIDITQNVKKLSKRIGIVLGSSLVYHRLKGYDYLKYFARLYEVPDQDGRINEVARAVNLHKRLDSFIETYSTGMKMRISLARALLHDPPFLILDEFTMGLDPGSARDMRQTIKDMDKTVLLTTNNMTDAEVLSQKLAFISKGKLSVFNSIDSLSRQIQGKLKIIVVLGHESDLAHDLNGMSYRLLEDGRVEIEIDERDLSETLGLLSKRNVKQIETRKPTLEEAYLEYTGESLNKLPAIAV